MWERCFAEMKIGGSLEEVCVLRDTSLMSVHGVTVFVGIGHIGVAQK